MLDKEINPDEKLAKIEELTKKIDNPEGQEIQQNFQLLNQEIKNKKTSLLNKWNQLHNCKNVFVTDGACMPSTSTQNPSLTFMAITARAANYAISQMKKMNI